VKKKILASITVSGSTG